MIKPIDSFKISQNLKYWSVGGEGIEEALCSSDRKYSLEVLKFKAIIIIIILPINMILSVNK